MPAWWQSRRLISSFMTISSLLNGDCDTMSPFFSTTDEETSNVCRLCDSYRLAVSISTMVF